MASCDEGITLLKNLKHAQSHDEGITLFKNLNHAHDLARPLSPEWWERPKMPSSPYIPRFVPHMVRNLYWNYDKFYDENDQLALQRAYDDEIALRRSPPLLMSGHRFLEKFSRD